MNNEIVGNRCRNLLLHNEMMRELKDIKIAVLGLGYVGLPLARLFSTKFSTIGYDKNRQRVECLMSGHDATREVDDAVRAIQGASRENVRGMEEASMSVGRSTELATMAGDSLRVIVDVVQETADRVRAIATAAEEQSAASEEINRGTDEVNRIAAETAEVMEQSSQAVSELARMGQELRQLVEQLKRG